MKQKTRSLQRELSFLFLCFASIVCILSNLAWTDQIVRGRTNDRDQMSSLLLLLFVIKLIRYCSLQIYPSGRVSCNWLSPLLLVSLLFSLLIITPSFNLLWCLLRVILFPKIWYKWNWSMKVLVSWYLIELDRHLKLSSRSILSQRH